MQRTRDVAEVLEGFQSSPLTAIATLQQNGLTAGAQCRAVLSYLQLTIGLVGPALLQAVVETRFFMQHAQQRRQLGLQPEKGWEPCIYAAIGHLLLDLDVLSAFALTYVLLGVLNLLAHALSANL